MNLELQKGSRSKILAFLLFSLMGVFTIRLFYLQIIQHSYYVDIARMEQVKRLTIPAKRGVIYALDGQSFEPLVMNQTVYTVFADPQITTENDKIIDTIRKIAGGNARPNLDKLLEVEGSRYQILATRISRVQADKIKAEKLSGIGFQEISQRYYPEGVLAAQTLGFINHEGVANYGIESALDSRLTGKDGLLQSVTDVGDVPLTIGKDNIDRPAIDGENIVLSLDRNIQSKTEQALLDGMKRTGADKSSAIIIDPQSGKIMAMANLPTYNPAEFNKVEDASVFNNSVVSAPYEPGSIIKTFTMSVGIDKGVVSPESTYVNTDFIEVGDKVISNASRGQTGTITFQHALNWSLNTGFVTVAQRLGDGENINRQSRDTIYDYFHNKFRLGQLTGVEVQGEEEGIIWSPSTSEGNAVRYSNMAFGQGMNVTMVQVAAAFSSIVNGGRYFKPTVIEGTLDKDDKLISNKPKLISKPISKSTADQVREMTYIARNSVLGNGDKAGYYVGGKTGTSEVIKDGSYFETDETVGSYIGFGGDKDVSRYVIMVQLSGEHKELSGQDARTVFTDISNWMLDYLDIQPKG